MEFIEPSFLVFSDDWGEHPSSCQHLFKQIATNHQVLWVNTIGLRSPRLSLVDFKKAFFKIKKMISGASNKTGLSKNNLNITVLQPHMLPFPQLPCIRQLNRTSVIESVKKHLHKLSMENCIVVTTVPNACDYVDAFCSKQIVYYCVDDFSEWPGHDKKFVLGMEDVLIKKSSQFIATSDKLFKHLARFGKPTHLLTHGVDLELFTKQTDSEHPLLKNIPKPRVGYFGLLDERFDQDLFYAVAERLPNVSFVITGRREIEYTKLEGLSNVYITAPVPYMELPALVKGWNALLLPYVRNELTEAINPLKLKEYIATGKKVISVQIPEAVQLSSYISIADDVEKWISGINSSINFESIDIERKNRFKFLIGEAWTTKANNFIKICMQ